MKTKPRTIFALLLLILLTISGCSAHRHRIPPLRYGPLGAQTKQSVANYQQANRGPQAAYAASQHPQQSSGARQEIRNAGHARSGRR